MRRHVVVIAALVAGCSSPPVAAPTPTVAIAPVSQDPAPVLAPTPSAERGAPRVAAGPTSIAWETDERTARERARREGLPMLVWVRADWATAAIEMERKAWSDPRVMAEARRFVAFKLDVTAAEGDAELYAERYGVSMMPETVFFDGSGRKAGNVRGAVTADELLKAMRRASE